MVKSLTVLAVAAVFVAIPALAQTPAPAASGGNAARGEWQMPRTPEGKPNFVGLVLRALDHSDRKSGAGQESSSSRLFLARDGKYSNTSS